MLLDDIEKGVITMPAQRRPGNQQRQEGVITEEKGEYYYRCLYESLVIVNSVGEPEDVIRSLVECIAKALEVKGCSLMLYSPDKRLLLHRVAYGLSDGYIKKGPVSSDKSIADALEGKSVVVLDVTENGRMQYPEQAKKEGISSILTVPMMLKEEIIGVLRVYTGKPYHFTEDDIYFVTAFTNLGAITLDNAKRYTHLREGYESFRRSTF